MDSSDSIKRLAMNVLEKNKKTELVTENQPCNYNKKNVNELRRICKELKIRGYFKKNKKAIIELIIEKEKEKEIKKSEEPQEPQPQQERQPPPLLSIINNNENVSHNVLINIIQKQKEKEQKNDIWKDSPYKDLVKLQSNNVGIVGEELINTICKLTNIPANCDGSKTKKINGGEGDGIIKGMTVEIKTAHRGSKSPSFQHELGEVPWKSKYMIFVDISPDCIYLTIWRNVNEETYKNIKRIPYFPDKKITWRKNKGAFKFDTSIKMNEKSIKTGYAIKITSTTTNQFVSSFIQKMII